MLATLSLPAPRWPEAAASQRARRQNHDARKVPVPWVAEVLGPSKHFGLKRRFLRPLRDYADASRRGRSGVQFVFTLAPDSLYEVNEVDRRGRESRRFVEVVDGAIVDVEIPWENAGSGSTF